MKVFTVGGETVFGVEEIGIGVKIFKDSSFFIEYERIKYKLV
jgi:hypothetical protein